MVLVQMVNESWYIKAGFVFFKLSWPSHHNGHNCLTHLVCWINIFMISFLSACLKIMFTPTYITSATSFKMPLCTETISWWKTSPPTAWKLPAGCRAGKKKRRRRSCELACRSCWPAWRSCPQSSWCGRGGHAGSVGGKTWWAPTSLALWISLSTGPSRSGASSDTSSLSLLAVHLKNKDMTKGFIFRQKIITSSVYRSSVVYTTQWGTLSLIKRHFVPIRNKCVGVSCTFRTTLHQLQWVHLTHRCSDSWSFSLKHGGGVKIIFITPAFLNKPFNMVAVRLLPLRITQHTAFSRGMHQMISNPNWT